MRINLSPHFKRAYKNLPPDIQADFDNKIQIFINNPRHPQLRTHKLKGKLHSCLSFSLMNGYRVLFEFAEDQSVNLLDAGAHDKYRQWKK